MDDTITITIKAMGPRFGGDGSGGQFRRYSGETSSGGVLLDTILSCLTGLFYSLT